MKIVNNISIQIKILHLASGAAFVLGSVALVMLGGKENIKLLFKK